MKKVKCIIQKHYDENREVYIVICRSRNLYVESDISFFEAEEKMKTLLKKHIINNNDLIIVSYQDIITGSAMYIDFHTENKEHAN
jgi:5-formaminoimidazole-4-carboxamide-1-beta-D-ribofuranosyl 5'-monophosphate synthetase